MWQGAYPNTTTITTYLRDIPLEQGEDLRLFPAQEAVDGVPAGPGVVEAAGDLAVLPAPRPGPVQLEEPTDPRQRPARCDRVGDQDKEGSLDGRVDTSRDRAAQAQLAFPRSASNSMACSTIVAVSRALSSRRRASSDNSARSARGRPGRDAAADRLVHRICPIQIVRGPLRDLSVPPHGKA